MNNKLAAFKMPQKQSMSAFANIPRQTEIMGQPHMLSYINPEEEAMLQQMRGGMPPVAGPGGVPAFWSLSGWANDTFGTSFGDGSGGIAQFRHIQTRLRLPGLAMRLETWALKMTLVQH
jgi:hypothetical protein